MTSKNKRLKGSLLRSYGTALSLVMLFVCLAFLVERFIPHASLSLLFLTGTLVVAARTGLGPSLFASVLSFLAYNFFFTTPKHTFQVADEGNVATLIFFLLIAAITGNLAARMEAESARRRDSLLRISNLYEFSRSIASMTLAKDVMNALVDHVSLSLKMPAAVFASEGEPPTVLGAHTGFVDLPDHGTLKKAWSMKSSLVHSAGRLILSIDGTDGRLGLLSIAGNPSDDQIELTRSLCEQAAVALDRTRLAGDLEEARVAAETEQLRSALLTSVSHDLRTPLASIIGSTTSLLEYGHSFSEEDHQELLTTVVDEARRLDRHVQNLLDMTRIGQGRLELRRDWVDIHDIVSSALGRLKTALRTFNVVTDIDPNVPLLWVHGTLLEQALVNLLDNAVRFSTPGMQMSIHAHLLGEHVVIEVHDQGPGIAESEREKIFDMFFTARQGDRGGKGTGLGLAICRGMVVAHGGFVTAMSGKDGKGTCMRISLPLKQSPE